MKMITLGELSRRLGVQYYKIQYMVKTGKIDTPDISGGNCMFTKRLVGQIMDLLEEKGHPMPGCTQLLQEMEES